MLLALNIFTYIAEELFLALGAVHTSDLNQSKIDSVTYRVKGTWKAKNKPRPTRRRPKPEPTSKSIKKSIINTVQWWMTIHFATLLTFIPRHTLSNGVFQ